MEDNDFNNIINSDPGFQMENSAPAIIKVVGVGGGGSNAINHMFSQDVAGVSFAIMNTDKQALESSKVPNRLILGPNTCKGLGAGNDPELAKKAAEESVDDIAKVFSDGTQMAFITAGMGGGTGTGASPVVARVAREKGILTIGIVTIPFLFEGRPKILKALKGADEMSKYVDAIMVINNERLTEIYADLDIVNAFDKADDTLSTAARSISDMINATGKINLDFNDVQTTLRNGGVAIISSGYANGERRITNAINNALHSPLLRNRDIFGAKKLLMNFYFNPKAEKPLGMGEMIEVNEFTCNFNSMDCIWGLAFDETLTDDNIKVTILASGFNVTINDDETIQAPKTTTISSTDDEDNRRLDEEYGKDKIIKQEIEQTKARYILLSNKDIDNDDLVELLWSSPTFKRPAAIKEQARDMQNPDTSKSAPTEEAQPQKNNNTRTIKF